MKELSAAGEDDTSQRKTLKIHLRSQPLFFFFFLFVLLSVQGFELFEVELHRELASLHVRVRRGKNRAVFRQGCVQGQNISSPPSPNLSTASDPYHCVCVRACVCVSFTLGVCRVLYSYGYVVMLCIMA